MQYPIQHVHLLLAASSDVLREISPRRGALDGIYLNSAHRRTDDNRSGSLVPRPHPLRLWVGSEQETTDQGADPTQRISLQGDVSCFGV